MKSPRPVEIDWIALQRAFERFDPTWEDEPLPYLNLRTGKISYFGEEEGVDFAETLDFDQHIALTLSPQDLTERHARMRAFAAAVPEADLSARLRRALSEEGGVGRFYEILSEHPTLCARWERVEGPRVRELLVKWLESELLAVKNDPPWRY